MSSKMPTPNTVSKITLLLMFLWLVVVAPLAFSGVFNEIVDAIRKLLMYLPSGWIDTSTPVSHIQTIGDVVEFARESSIYEAIFYSALTFFVTISAPIVAMSSMGEWARRASDKSNLR